MPFARVRGIDIFYEIHGQGPRLFYLPGTGGDLRHHPNPFDYPLAPGFEMLCHDQRGLGQSGRPDEPYTMAGYAEDAAALMDGLDWGACPVVCYSFGGMVGQELAIRHPELVSKLVLMSTTSGGAGGASYPLHELGGLSLDERADKVTRLFDLRRTPAWQEAHPDQFAAEVAATKAAMSVGLGEPGRRTGALRQLQARRQHDTWERLPGLSLPVLVAAGRYDGVALLADQEALAGRIPGARLEVFEGGHLFFLQEPSAFEVIREFLEA